MDDLYKREKLEEERYVNMLTEFSKNQRMLQGLSFVDETIRLKEKGEKTFLDEKPMSEWGKDFKNSRTAKLNLLFKYRQSSNPKLKNIAKIQDKNSYFYGYYFIDEEFVIPKDASDLFYFRTYEEPIDYGKRKKMPNYPTKQRKERDDVNPWLKRLNNILGVGQSIDEFETTE